MAHKDDWFRKPCLTADAKVEFEHRLSRARSSRPEYLRLQALSLQEAKAFEEALGMLNRIAATYPDHLPAWIHEGIARCLEALGRSDAAIESYIESIEIMKRHQGVQGDAHTSFASLVFRLGRADLYEKALGYLTDFWDPNPIFPVNEMQQFGWTAILLDELGHSSDAKPPAMRALAATTKQRSSAVNHPKLGLVEEQNKEMQNRLEQITGSRRPTSTSDARSLISAVETAAVRLLRRPSE